MTKWEELPIADRAQYMRVAVQNGYRDIRSIREAYNRYAEGGNLYETGGSKGNIYEEEGEYTQQMNKDYDRETAVNVAKTIGGFIPIVGTAIDAYDFVKEPSWENAGYLGLSLASDVFPLLKGAKALKAAKAATEMAEAAEIAKRAEKMRELSAARRRVAKLEEAAARSNINPNKIAKAKGDRGRAYNAALKARSVATHNAYVDASNRWFTKYWLPSTAYNTVTSLGQGINNQIDINNNYPNHHKGERANASDYFSYTKIPAVRYDNGGKVRKINKNSAEYKNNLRKQRLLNEAGYSVKEDGSWGPWQDNLYKGIFAGTNTDIVSTYKVKAGDSMWRIAHNNGMDLETLQKLNPQIHNNLIHPEDKVIISKKKAAKAYNIKEEWAKEKILNKDNLTAIQSVKHDDNYVVVDKKNATLTVYDPDNNPIYTTHNISTGKSGNDYNTITYVNEKGHIISGKGNESTPAGITKITGVGEYHGYPSFTRGRQTNGKYEDIASSLHFGSVDNKKASNGCVRVGGKELQDLSSLIGIKTNVYTLPEKRGSKFTVKDGKLNFVASNAYGSSEGAHKYWDDYNVHINKEYSPLSIKHKKASEDKTKEANITKYVETLSDSKKKLQKFFNLTSDEYNRLVNIALGIAEQETKFGTSRRKKLKDLTPDIVLNIIRGNSNRSRGITQIKLAGDNAGMQAIYRELNISEDNIDSPEKSAEATLARLAYMYNTEVKGRTFTGANNLEISPYDALLYKWNGHNEQLTKHLATPALNNYIQNVNKYANDFDLYSIRANGGRLMTRIY